MTTRKQPRRGVRPLTTQDIARAAALKRFREGAGLTQEELAGKLGVSQGALSDWERARKPLPPEVFASLSALAEETRAAPAGSAAEAAEIPEPEPPLQANIPDAPPPFETPPDSTPFAAQAGEALEQLVSGIQLEATRDVQVVYQFGGQLLGRFVDVGVGQIVEVRSGALAASLVQAAEVNAWIARVVALMRIGPVSTCVILHLTVVVEIVEYLRAKTRAEMEARAQVAQQQAAPAGAAEAFQAAAAAA